MKTTLEIQNLKCGGCANTIINKLSNEKNIKDVKVDHDNNTVAFSYNTDGDIIEMKTLLAKLGYPAVGEKNILTTKAKSFVSCAVGRMSK